MTQTTKANDKKISGIVIMCFLEIAGIGENAEDSKKQNYGLSGAAMSSPRRV